MKNQRHVRPKLCLPALVSYVLLKNCAIFLKKGEKNIYRKSTEVIVYSGVTYLVIGR